METVSNEFLEISICNIENIIDRINNRIDITKITIPLIRIKSIKDLVEKKSLDDEIFLSNLKGLLFDELDRVNNEVATVAEPLDETVRGIKGFGLTGENK